MRRSVIESLGNAAVAILAWRNTPWRGGELSPGPRDVLGQTKTDARGAFAVRVQRTDSVRFLEIHAVAAAPERPVVLPPEDRLLLRRHQLLLPRLRRPLI